MNKSLDVLAFFDLLIRDHKLTCGVSDKADVLYYNLDNIIGGHLLHEEFKVRDYERRVVIDTNFSNKFLNQRALLFPSTTGRLVGYIYDRKMYP